MPASICLRTAAGVGKPACDSRRSERLEDGADDRAREFGGHPIERVLILAEEGAWGRAASGRSVASYSWRNTRLGFSHSTLFSRTSRSSTRALIVMV